MKEQRGNPSITRRMARGIIVLLAGLAAYGPMNVSADPARAEEVFSSTVSELDLGGDFFFYLQTEELMAQAVGKARELAAVAADDESVAVDAVFERLDAFMRANGLYDGTGFGMSSRSVGDGLFSVKSFLGRAPSSPDPLFWSMLGGPPRKLAVLDCIPADAAVVLSFDVRPSDMWAFIQAAVREVGGDEVMEGFQAAVENWSEAAGGDIGGLIASLGGDMAVSIQLSRERTITLPMGETAVDIPEPSLLLAISVSDASLLGMLMEQARRVAWPMEIVEEGGADTHALEDFPDMPIPVRPAVALDEDILLVGSHVDTVASALSARATGNGLLAEPAFRKLAAPLPGEHNGLTYVDERFNTLVQDLQAASFESAGAPPEAAMMGEIMKRVAGWSSSGSAVAVRIVKPHGLLSHSITPTSGREMVLTAMAMPVAMVAGMSLPGFMQARERAAEMALLNTLRMAEFAKEMWAMEQNINEGAPVTEEDIAQYLPPGGLQLPPGYHLRLNPIGEDPIIIRPDGSVLRLR